MSSSIPSTYKALVIGPDHKGEVKEVSAAKLEDNDVLVKVAYATQNPTDWKHLDFVGAEGSIIGCDYSGTIVALGENLKNDSLKVGDKVASMVHGGKFSDKGAFAEYARVQSDLLWKVTGDGGVDLREAPQYGIAFTTAAQILYKRQGLPYPPQKISGDEWYLVNGGSTSVGLFAVQLAKLAGYKVIATSSPRNFDLVKSYGADAVVSYHDAAKAAEELQSVTGGGVSFGLDTISENGSIELTLDGFKKGGEGKKQLNLLLPPKEGAGAKAKELGVELGHSLAYTLMGKGFNFVPGMDVPAVPEDREFYVQLNKDTPELFIKKSGIKPNPIKELGGLDTILEGFQLMRDNKVSAQKLTYKIGA